MNLYMEEKRRMIKDYVCLDLETTGLDPKMDAIIEVAACRVRNGIIKEQLNLLVNPGRSIEERITNLTGITNQMVENKPYIKEVLPEILSFLGEDVLIGHRILFDYSFLKKAAVNEKYTFEKKGIDTLKLSRRFLVTAESKKLEDLCKYFGIPHNPHRALADVEATVMLYHRLGDAFYSKETEKEFTPTPLNYQVKRETPITIPQKERLYRLIEKHGIIPDYEVEQLTRSQASRITDRILATYGR